MKPNELLAHFTVTEGKPIWKNSEYVKVNLPKFEGCKGILHIKKKWNRRSVSQNALYWLWLEVASQSIGHTENELNVIFKGLFAPKKEVSMGGKTYVIPKSTKELSKGEMVSYLFEVEQKLSELGIKLPRPEDVYNK